MLYTKKNKIITFSSIVFNSVTFILGSINLYYSKNIITIFTQIVLFFILWLSIRLHFVNKERNRVFNIVRALAYSDADKGSYDYIIRFKSAFEDVSIDSMVFKFYKPIKSFYKNHPALKDPFPVDYVSNK